MQDASDTLTYKGKNYLIKFSFNVLVLIQAKYKTLEAWINEAYGKESGEPSADALRYCIWAMVNEGIDIENDEKGTQEPHISEAKAGWILSEYVQNGGIEKLVGKIDTLLTQSVANDSEESKNE